MTEAWRSMKPEDRNEFLDWVAAALNERWELGRERYQSDRLGFQGDPLNQATEEALDQVYYLWVAKRQRDA